MEPTNVKITVDEKSRTATFTVDLSYTEETEKGTTRVATSHGWQNVSEELAPGIRYTLNVFTSEKAKAKASAAAEQAAEIAALRRALADAGVEMPAAEVAAMPAAAKPRSRASKAAA